MDMLLVEDMFQEVIEDIFEHALDLEGTYPAKIENKGITGIPALAYDMVDVLKVKWQFTDSVVFNCYNVEEDVIMLKPLSYFASDEHFLQIFFHELAHWTGANNRLNRITAKTFVGKREIFIEEVMAEIVAKYLCDFFYVPDTFRTNSVYNYIFQQITEAIILGENPLEIYFTAVDYAIEVINYIEVNWEME